MVSKMVLVTKEMKIGDILEKYPQAANVMESYGLHCVGCDVNPFDTLENAAKIHKMSDEEINSIASDLNKVALNTKSEIQEEVKDPKIFLTELAAKKIVEVMKSSGKAGSALRVGLMAGGCAGYTYSMDFDDKKNADDFEMEERGVKIFVDKESVKKINGTTIDYLETLQQSGFKINNPNARSTCGCGKSSAI